MSGPDECVYWHLCIDKACPCKLCYHEQRDPDVATSFRRELDGYAEEKPLKRWEYWLVSDADYCTDA